MIVFWAGWGTNWKLFVGVLVGLGWGFVVNLGFSAAIYLMALRTRLPGERVREIIDTTPHDEEPHS